MSQVEVEIAIPWLSLCLCLSVLEWNFGGLNKAFAGCTTILVFIPIFCDYHLVSDRGEGEGWRQAS